MSTAAMIPMKWADKSTQGCEEYCACCGRKLSGRPLWVEVIDGGKQVAAPGLNTDTSDSGYLGFFPVGRACARRYFHGFTHKMD